MLRQQPKANPTVIDDRRVSTSERAPPSASGRRRRLICVWKYCQQYDAASLLTPHSPSLLNQAQSGKSSRMSAVPFRVAGVWRSASAQRRHRTAGTWQSAGNKNVSAALCGASHSTTAPWQMHFAAALCDTSHSTRTRCRRYWRPSKGARAPLKCNSSKPRPHPRPWVCAAPCAPAQRRRQAWPARDELVGA